MFYCFKRKNRFMKFEFLLNIIYLNLLLFYRNSKEIQKLENNAAPRIIFVMIYLTSNG